MMITEDQLLDPIKRDPKKKNESTLITEYVETGEGDGISIIPLKEMEKNIDGKTLIIDQVL